MDRKKLMELRQKLLDLLKLCEWDLISEHYEDASHRTDEIKEAMDILIDNYMTNYMIKKLR